MREASPQSREGGPLRKRLSIKLRWYWACHIHIQWDHGQPGYLARGAAGVGGILVVCMSFRGGSKRAARRRILHDLCTPLLDIKKRYSGSVLSVQAQISAAKKPLV